MFIQSFEFITDALADLADTTFLAVEFVAVVEHELHIVKKLLHSVVVVCVETLLNGPKIHWLLYDVSVIRYAKFLRVYWIMKDPRLTKFPEA